MLCYDDYQARVLESCLQLDEESMIGKLTSGSS